MAVVHEDYVAKGYCGSIDTSKTWCCLPDGHAGKHSALYLLPDGSFAQGIEWD